MTFNSSVFIPFLALVALAYFCTFTGRRERIWVLLVTNLVFYGTWSISFIPYLIGTGTLDFLIAQRLEPDKLGNPGKHARPLLALSILANLGVLIAFKYAGFLGWTTHNLIAPLGISFYTFQSMSYTIDVYRGTYKPKTSLLEFLASLTFFPHLLAGPIIRFSVLLPQFKSLSRPTREDTTRALMLIAVGLVKKSLADLVAPIVQGVYERPTGHGFVDSWAAVLSFAAQIYGDFSGYTDMALGIALLLGFSLPPNFTLPYLSTSPAEFWKRWHISLSTWFRDYLFYPLALGPLRGRPYLNIIVVMLLAGVWHGPGINNALFGLYHGVLLAGTYVLIRLGADRMLPATRLVQGARIALTFYLVLIGQMIFRAQSLDIFRSMLWAMHHFSHPQFGGYRSLAVAIVALLVGHLIDYHLIQKNGLSRRPVLRYVAATLCFAFGMVAGTRPEFIYFQF